MSDLTAIEKMRLEKLFGMKSGYVLDFSDRTFQAFILDTTRVDVFSEEYGQCSKANRLRFFWQKESNYITAKLIYTLLEHWKMSQQEISEQDKRVYEECLKTADRLKQENPIANIDALQPNSDDKNFDLLAESIREAIEKNKPESALDRLHTFVTKYIRRLCDKHQLTYDKEEPLHSLFGKYAKHLISNKLVESVMADRILKYSINVLDAFNDIRNNKSFAHDNPILNYNESILIFNNITNAIKFIQTIEDKYDRKNKHITTAKADWSELPF